MGHRLKHRRPNLAQSISADDVAGHHGVLNTSPTGPQTMLPCFRSLSSGINIAWPEADPQSNRPRD